MQITKTEINSVSLRQSAVGFFSVYKLPSERQQLCVYERLTEQCVAGVDDMASASSFAASFEH